MAVDCTTRGAFIDRHDKPVVPPQRKIFFDQSPGLRDLSTEQLSTDVASGASPTKVGAVNGSSTSRKVRLIKTATVPPVTQVTVRVSRPAAGPCFLHSSLLTTMRHLVSMAQGVVYWIAHEPSTVSIRNFWDKPVHLPKHTALGIAFPSAAHIMTVGPASSGVVKVNERGEIKSGGNPSKHSAETQEDEVCVCLDDETDRRVVLQLSGECQDM